MTHAMTCDMGEDCTCGASMFAAEAREVARAHLLGSWAYRKGEPERGFDRVGVYGRPQTATDNGSNPRTAEDEARLLAGLPTFGGPMTDPIPLFVELCAGTAALSLRLQGGKAAKPPVSRMGAKTGYANAILRVMGLRPGQGAERYLWCEPDPGCRLLLEAYRDPDLARAAAEIIRGWADEDPRALWERLRAEGPVKAPPVTAYEVGRWGVLGMCSMGQPIRWNEEKGRLESNHGSEAWSTVPCRWNADGEISKHDGSTVAGVARKLRRLPASCGHTTPDARTIDPREVARWLRITSANRLINLGPDWRNTGEGGSTFGGAEFCTDAAALAEATAAAVECGGDVVADARAVDPREVARWSCLANGAYRQGNIDSGLNPSECGHPGWGTFGAKRSFAEKLAAADWSTGIRDAHTTTDARSVVPESLPPGCVVFHDPPYKDTTGYSHDFPRSEWLPVVKAWADAGALVVISEAEPIAELDGWHTVEITGERKGQRRTFGGTREWLTMNQEPAWRPAQQASLFGGFKVASTGRD